MLDGPVELEMSRFPGKVLVYRKMYGNHDSYATVGSEYADAHPEECTPEEIEAMLDRNHGGHGQKWEPEMKTMFRELFDFMGVDK